MPVTSIRQNTLPSSAQLERQIGAGSMVRAGQDGPSVREAQALLQAHGHQLNIDGDFGPQTRDAVIAFQRSRGIGTDGVIGPETLRELRTPAGGVDRRSGTDRGVTPAPQDRIPGQTGADFQRRAELDAARRQRETGTPTAVTVAPSNMSERQKFDHYRNIIMQNGGQDPLTSDRPVVLGVRGMDRAGNRHETTNNRSYDDTFVVLDRNGRVTELAGATHAGQRTSSLVSAVGLIRTGNFNVVPNGVRASDNGLASFHVRTLDGSGNIPGIRDRNADGRMQDGELARRDTMTEILFHPGSATSPRSIGCQTMPPEEYRRFLQAVGNRGFSFSLVDANGRT